MEKKYELTDKTNGLGLRRIRALHDFGNVNADDLGGWIESENNLSQTDNCWVYDEAFVSGDAQVFGDACAAEEQLIQFSQLVLDITERKNLSTSIQVQTGLHVFNNKIICYKHVRKDLSSLYDPNFKYAVGEYAVAENVDESNASCPSGLHVSHATYHILGRSGGRSCAVVRS